MSHARDIRDLVRALKQRGWTSRITGAGHYQLRSPDPNVPPIFLPCTPSDHRSLLNVRAFLKRNGVNL